MACNITAGIGRPDCPGETPGAYDTIYLYNRSRVTFTVAGDDSVEMVNFQGAEGFYQVVAKKGSVVGSEELQAASGVTSYTHTLVFSLADLSIEARNFVNDLNGAQLGAIVRTKGDKFLLYGYNEGLTMTGNTMSTEVDALGETITLSEEMVNEKTRRFWDTDLATTIAAITPIVAS